MRRIVMDKSQYTKLLNEASINNKEKFRSVSLERPKTRGRPPKHYHPLLQKEKELETVVRRTLRKDVAVANIMSERFTSGSSVRPF